MVTHLSVCKIRLLHSDSKHATHRLRPAPLVLDDLSCLLSPECHLHFNPLRRRAPNHKLCYEIHGDSRKSLGYVLRILLCQGNVTTQKIYFKKMYCCRTKLHWREKNRTGKHSELFKELRKLFPNPIFSNSVTTTTKPSYMTNSVILKSRKWQEKDILRLFHNSV